MSGPKGYSYSVVSAEELARRELQATKTRCVALAARAEQARARARALWHKVPAAASRPRGDDQASWSTYETALERTLGAAETATREAISATFSDQIRTQLSGVRIRIEMLAVPAAGPRAPGTEPAEQRDRERLHEIAASVLSASDLIGTIEDETARAGLVRTAELALDACAGGPATAAEGLLTRLQADTGGALREQRGRQRVRDRADSVRRSVSGVPGHEAEALAELVGQARTDAQVDDAERRAEELLRQHRESQDRAFVIAQTTEALQGLGYEVAEDFTVQAFEGEAQVVLAPGLDRHGLQLRFPPGTPRLLTNVVALEETDPGADVAAEETTCAHLNEIRSTWEAGGVRSEVFHARGAGQVPVERVPAVAAAPILRRARSERRRRSAQRTRGAS